MADRGRHLALTPRQVARLRRFGDEAIDDEEDADDNTWGAFLDLEERLPARWDYSLRNAWDGIHRGLTLDNTPNGRLDHEAGDEPLSLCILGGEPLTFGDEYVVHLIEPDGVAALASALAEVEEAWMRKRFFALDPSHALGCSIREDGFVGFAEVWACFRGLPAFFAGAAAAGRAVVFGVDH